MLGGEDNIKRLTFLVHTKLTFGNFCTFSPPSWRWEWKPKASPSQCFFLYHFSQLDQKQPGNWVSQLACNGLSSYHFIFPFPNNSFTILQWIRVLVNHTSDSNHISSLKTTPGSVIARKTHRTQHIVYSWLWFITGEDTKQSATKVHVAKPRENQVQVSKHPLSVESHVRYT